MIYGFIGAGIIFIQWLIVRVLTHTKLVFFLPSIIDSGSRFTFAVHCEEDKFLTSLIYRVAK